MCGENGLLSRNVVIGRAAVFASPPATRFAFFLLLFLPPTSKSRLNSLFPGSAGIRRRRHSSQAGARFQKLKIIVAVDETSAVSIV